MVQFTRERTYSNVIVEVLTNETSKYIYIKFYFVCWNVTTLTSFKDVQVFNNFVDFIFFCTLKSKN